ncbi:MAG: NAD(+)/NADH kinase [Candidatus Zixiibacteriota bacterium]
MHFGLIANLNRQGVVDAVNAFLEWAKNKNQPVLLSDKLKSVVTGIRDFAGESDLPGRCDILVSMGGDGTLLSTARIVGSRDTNLLGINLGSLGFLTQVTLTDMSASLDRIVRNDYEIQERMVLEAQINGKAERLYALNEVVVDNRPLGRMIDIKLEVNREDILTYRCDGLIIATPTGSTGYSLSVGGPIIHPTMEAIIAAPISAFSLSTRPMILRPADILELSVGSEHKAAALTLDGQETRELKGGDTVLVKRAGFSHKFIVFPDRSFYKICRNKLHWGRTPTGESE